MPQFVLMIPLGADVVQYIMAFARAHLTGTVLAASGTAKYLNFHNPGAELPYLMWPGSYSLVSLRGHFKRHPNGDYESSFSATIANDNGYVFGGVLAGSIVATQPVKVIVSVPENPEFVELALNEDNAPQEIPEAVMFPAQADDNVDQGDADDGDHGDAENGSPPPAMENGGPPN